MPGDPAARRGRSPLWDGRAASVLVFVLLLVLGTPTGSLSAPTPSRSGGGTVTLEWVGDIAFGAAYGLPPGGPAGAMAAVRRELSSAGVLAGNLEGTLGVTGTTKCGGGRATGRCFAFQAPPSYAQGLRSLRFSVMNLANNHSRDAGPAGLSETVAALDRAGVQHTGRPGEITLRTVRGVRIAFLGFAPYSWTSSLLDIPAAQAQIRLARRRAELVVVFIHAGAEGADRTHTPDATEYFLGENRGDARRFGQAAIDAGASIVQGSGPHVIRGIERYRNRMIAYSLGDFAGPHTLSTAGLLSESAILRVTLDAHGRVLSGRWISVRLVPPGVPAPDRSDASARLVAQLSREDFGDRRYPIGSSGAIAGCRDAAAIPRRICRRIAPSPRR